MDWAVDIIRIQKPKYKWTTFELNTGHMFAMRNKIKH